MAGFVLPSVKDVGYLDPEIAGEGQRVMFSEGEQPDWAPPPPRPVMPDMSQIKSIRHYFGRTGHRVYPAWLYHENGEERLVRNAQEAQALGVVYRPATIDEKGRYGIDHVWDWAEGCKWRAQPWFLKKFDPKRNEQGKNYVPAVADPMATQAQLLAALTDAIKNNQVQRPSEVSEQDWDDFTKFLAFKRAQRATETNANGDAASTLPPDLGAGQSALGGALGSFADEHAGKGRGKR